jgi:hypothetical protein
LTGGSHLDVDRYGVAPTPEHCHFLQRRHRGVSAGHQTQLVERVDRRASQTAEPAVTAYVLAAGRPRVGAPERRVRLSQAAAEPVQERDWRGGGVAGCGDGVAPGHGGGGGGGVHEAVVIGGSVQLSDVLLGDEEGGMW